MPALKAVLNFPKTTLLSALIVLAIGLYPLDRFGDAIYPFTNDPFMYIDDIIFVLIIAYFCFLSKMCYDYV